MSKLRKKEEKGRAPAHAKRSFPPVLKLEGIAKTFGGVKALDDVAFDLFPGEVHCLAGENGSGKSTLIKIITGVHRPDGGRIEIDGEIVPSVTPALAQAAGIAVIWQDLALFPEMSVMENIALHAVLGPVPRRVDYAAMRRTAEAKLAELGVPLDVEAPLRDYAIAQRQIVAIARALVGGPKIVFMDEPTASLTQSETDRLLDIVRRLAAAGIAVVFVSHRLAEVLEISNRVTVLRDGGRVGVFPGEGMTQSRLTELMTGRTFESAVRAADRGSAPAVLEVADLGRAGDYADIDLTVRGGETLGLTGLLGSGRTELALALFGMRPHEAGTIRLNGIECRFRSNRDAIRAGIAYLSEDRLSLGLVQPQAIEDNIVVTVLGRITRGGFLAERKKGALVAKWIEDLAIKVGAPDDPLATLSGGNQQRVAIAKWLAIEPKVMILDSPTVGVDVGAREDIFQIVRDLAEAGLAILLISDEVPEVYFNADRVLHMAEGRIVGEYDPREVALQDLEKAVHG